MHPATTAQPDLYGKDAVIDWTGELLDQLDGHWTHQLRPRLDGLTDQEYLWEPVPGCWNVRARGAEDSPASIGSGPFTLDLLRPPPSPAPVTTIAWRMAHLIVSVLGERVAGQFGGPVVSYEDFRYAGTAVEALAQLDGVYAQWIAGVRGLDTAGLSRSCGPSEVQYGNPADLPLVSLVLHVSREVIHHGAEIALLRDLYTPGHVVSG
jgi:hypothetical protein